MLVSIPRSEIADTMTELKQTGVLITGVIVALAIFLGYVLSTVLVKPFARVTKAIEGSYGRLSE